SSSSGGSGGSNVTAAILRAEGVNNFRICTEIPGRGNFVIDWNRTTIRARVHNPRNVRSQYVNPLEAAIDIGGIGAFHYTIDGGYFDEDGRLVVINTTVPDARRRSLINASMTYTARIRYTFIYSWIRPGHAHTLPRNASLPDRFMRVSGYGLSVSSRAETEVVSRLTRIAEARDETLARTAWYRNVLPRF
ncbi:MAG: hypothetical protein FWD93_04145, partial [Coriobacteriia bacterium]|nr:hypothetical protein [Coriobacteriia bacterium]